MNTTFSDAALRQAAQRLAHQMSAALPAEDAGFSAGSDTRMEAVAPPDDHGGRRLSVPSLTKRRDVDGGRTDMASRWLCNGVRLYRR